jgi:DNA gyrase subunit A
VADISIVGRNTQGVRLIRLGEGERLTGIERVAGLEVSDVAGDEAGDVVVAPGSATDSDVGPDGDEVSPT